MRYSAADFDIGSFIRERPSSPDEIHVSTIISDILRSIDPDLYGGDVDDDVRRLWELGFLWEEVVGDAMARRWYGGERNLIVQPRMELDGIVGHPDGIRIESWRLLECKYTRKSGSKPITDPKFRHWLWQIKAYLKMIDSTECDLIVCYANGDYSDRSGCGPGMALHHKLRFGQREVDRNWNMLLRNRDRILRERG